MIRRIKISKPSIIQVQYSIPDLNTVCFASDYNNPKLIYFYRETENIDYFEISFPIAAEINLHIKSENEMPTVRIKVTEFEPEGIITDTKTKEFIDFALQFSKITSLFNGQKYTDKNKQFKIHVYNELETDTPVRIERDQSYIEVNKSIWDKETVFEKFALLLHEYSHNFISENQDINANDYSQDSEFESDFYAMQIYKSLGFPKFEAYNAFLYIFDDSNYNIDRLDSIFENLYG